MGALWMFADIGMDIVSTYKFYKACYSEVKLFWQRRIGFCNVALILNHLFNTVKKMTLVLSRIRRTKKFNAYIGSE